VSGPGGIDPADLSMLDLFRIEAENYTKILDKGLVEVEGHQSPEGIEPLMRAAHSIKGAARIVGLDLVVTLAHAMEDVLSAAQKGGLKLSTGHIDLLLQGNDVLSRLATLDIEEIPPWLAKEADRVEDLSRTIRESERSEPVASPPATAAPNVPPLSPERESLKTEEGHPSVPAGAAGGGNKGPRPPTEKTPERTEETSVRVVSDSLNRLMGLAGECLVQANLTKPFSASLLRAKNMHMELTSELEDIFHSMDQKSAARGSKERFGEALSALDRIRSLIGDHIENFDVFARSLERLADQLYSEVLTIRMRPFSDGTVGFPRMVRDLAKELNKKVVFQVVGGSSRVDRDILERLEAPLTHLLRNAVDHGLERPEERLAASKPPEGSLTLEARHASGMLHIRVTDDGKGVDLDKLRAKIVRDGRVSQNMASTLSRSELLDFLFLPGFSTASKVTEVSGRGVGLDVVMSMVEAVGGSVRAESEQGKGTSFHLYLPLTLSVVRGLVVDIGGEPYAIPLARIDRILVASREDLRMLEDKQFYTYENEHLGIVDAHQVLQTVPADKAASELRIAVISDRLNRYGLVVDGFLGERELVVIPLDSRLGKVPNISAGAILEDGSPALILDIDDLVRSIDNLLTHGKLLRIGERGEGKGAGRKRVLVVDDSLTVREVERRLLEHGGYEVMVGVDGMDGWNLLQGSSRFDLVVSDVDMPRMNGIEMIRRIKNDPRFKDLPVIIVSYKDREEDRIKGLEAGANYYLTKSSFHDEGLTNAVRDLIGEP
jgi:two-component system, chemotaxis family, sensor histidine kinase and response regulator WspE